MKGYLLQLWNMIDPIYFHCTRLCYVPDLSHGKTILRVRRTCYKGKPVVLTDGTMIRKNDTLLKIHLHNVRLVSEFHSMNNDIQKALNLYRKIRSSLYHLADFIKKEENCHVKAILGITMLYQGADRLGFEMFPIKNSYYRQFKKYTFLPINYLANASLPKEPVYLFMSRRTLENQYRRNEI
ncbi:hypothetical protein HNQ35_001918 [Cerasibacillus quisquiliarum]|mgnify:CR=1 FL=1|uniref:YkoP-like domain-containing protein n=1 Tax=Cerasibacillus quisquiliarum TaxID=227865 RepID=A0A511UXR2_9BACI|nr:hypothetical protein [Cerasibacillus quisquiliarum]MBB5146709.1 hypothetical protein [Cerasibacillus quisquiliarum]GEN31409.1 hypothetical protein CQU01_16470 [Cerasibacillus quisquiliarum]